MQDVVYSGVVSEALLTVSLLATRFCAAFWVRKGLSKVQLMQVDTPNGGGRRRTSKVALPSQEQAPRSASGEADRESVRGMDCPIRLFFEGLERQLGASQDDG